MCLFFILEQPIDFLLIFIMNQAKVSIALFSSTARLHIKSKYDIVIAGGGMIGQSLACALATNSKLNQLSTLLIESGSKPPTSLKNEFALRTSAISPSNMQWFSELGVSHYLAEGRVCPVKRMHVWDACSQSSVTFKPRLTQSDVAYIFENDTIQAGMTSLLDNPSHTASVNSIYDSKINFVSTQDELNRPWVKLTLGNGEEIMTKLLVGADGVNSTVRDTMDVSCVRWDYKQRATVANVRISSDAANDTAWQRFLPTGPIAMLPMDANHVNLIWHANNDIAKHLSKLTDKEFVSQANEALTYQADEISVANLASRFVDSLCRSKTKRKIDIPVIESVLSNTRASFPLGLMHANQYLAERMILVGDAAHRVHPLAGLGANLGFKGAQQVVKILERIVAEGGDVGTSDFWLDYQKQQQLDVLPLMFGLHGINLLYSNRLPPLAVLRSIGSSLVDAEIGKSTLQYFATK